MLVYAHRGASADFPEHSIAAYRAAVEQGADGFECDIRLTKDGEIICWHDSNTSRNSSENLVISQSTFQELSVVQPLRFETLLDLAIETKRNLAIETKHPVITAGAIERKLFALLNQKRQTIQESGIQIDVMSFSWLAAQRIRRSGFPAVFLIEFPVVRFANRSPILGPGLEIIKKDPGLVARTHSSGKKVFVWTVNDPVDVRLCADLGVDVIMSDKPGLAKQALG